MTKLDRREHVVNGIYVNDNGDRMQLSRVEYDVKWDTQIAYFIEPSGAEDHMLLSSFLDEYTLETEAEKPLATEVELDCYAQIKAKAQEIGKLAGEEFEADHHLDLNSRIAVLAKLIIETCDHIAALEA